MPSIGYESMWSESHSVRVLITFAGVAVLVIAVDRGASAQRAADLPRAGGADVMRAVCVTCHEADLILQQRLTRDGWRREIDKMVRWGALFGADADRDMLLTYLTGLGGATVVEYQPSDSAGAAVFQNQCLRCHDVDLVRQQRLTAAGWTREVDKMVRWGASVKDDEKSALVGYLSSGSNKR